MWTIGSLQDSVPEEAFSSKGRWNEKWKGNRWKDRGTTNGRKKSWEEIEVSKNREKKKKKKEIEKKRISQVSSR